MSEAAENLRKLRQEVRELLKELGRAENDVAVVLVSKTVEPERISEVLEAENVALGENRVQEFLSKKDQLPPQTAWHMIGHLQTNKVKSVVGEVVLIQSLDRPELAAEIERQAEKKNIEHVDCLIQVNSSGDASKFGFDLAQVAPWLESFKAQRIRIRGLMTIGPLSQDAEETRQAFRRTRELRDQLSEKFTQHDWSILSMGMSGDFKIAIEEGSTMIRPGTVVFGARTKQ